MIGPLPWVGGKRRLAPTIARLIPEHVTYVEPFAGGAQVLFHKRPSRVEVINDLDGELVNFFRVCKHHSRELARSLRHMPASREMFREISAQSTEGLTDVIRAARFYYLQKTAWGGSRTRRSFHFAVAKPLNFNPSRIPGALEAASTRLERVQLECLPYERVIDLYDRRDTFFFIDPPYVGAKLYEFNFDDAEFTRLADRLARLKGKFILSINDHPIARDAFRAFTSTEVRLSYTASRRVPRVTELLFSNFALARLDAAA
jgi:DNA adenine methylase